MSSILIEPHYLGSLEYFTLIKQYDSLIFATNDRFQKQTFRNRCQVLGSNKILSLIVPVAHKQDTIFKDVRIDNNQSWRRDHWGAIYSSYGKAPFFEFFADEFNKLWNMEHKFLLDLNIEFSNLTFRLLQIDVKMALNQDLEENAHDDCRNLIVPKKSFTHRKIYDPVPYGQLFGDKFEPNLSIADLIMNEGPQAKSILAASFLKR